MKINLLLMRILENLKIKRQKDSELMSRAKKLKMNEPSSFVSGNHLTVLNHSIWNEDEEIDNMINLSLSQEMHDTFDPYTNPGQDIVVDEVYHGVDHGDH